MEKIVVLTGAGISAESGLKTFRDADGLWEGHRVEEVATPEAWHKNPELVLDFYNQRRAQLKLSQPNLAHQSLAALEHKYDVRIVTQNVDDLHERAGSKKIIHLHGELLKVRSERNPDLIYTWQEDLTLGQKQTMVVNSDPISFGLVRRCLCWKGPLKNVFLLNYALSSALPCRCIQQLAWLVILMLNAQFITLIPSLIFLMS